MKPCTGLKSISLSLFVHWNKMACSSKYDTCFFHQVLRVCCLNLLNTHTYTHRHTHTHTHKHTHIHIHTHTHKHLHSHTHTDIHTHTHTHTHRHTQNPFLSFLNRTVWVFKKWHHLLLSGIKNNNMTLVSKWWRCLSSDSLSFINFSPWHALRQYLVQVCYPERYASV